MSGWSYEWPSLPEKKIRENNGNITDESGVRPETDFKDGSSKRKYV